MMTADECDSCGVEVGSWTTLATDASAKLKDNASRESVIIPEAYITDGISRYIYISLTPFLCLFIVGGNVLTIGAVVRNISMRTLTNCFVVSLSVADTLVGALTPFYVAIQATMDEEGKPMSRTNRAACLSCMWTMQVTVTASVLHLLAIAFERYLAVFKPLRYPSLVTKERVQTCLVLIWTAAVGVSMPPVLGWNQWQGAEITDCGFVDLFPRMHLLLLYILPVGSCLLTLTGVYIVIFSTAYRQQRRLRAETQLSSMQGHQPGSTRRREMKITKMLATVVGIFFMCWSPYLVLTLVVLERGDRASLGLQRIYAYTKLLMVLNSGMNPLIYGFRNRDFRNAFRRFFGCTVTTDWNAASVVSESNRNSV